MIEPKLADGAPLTFIIEMRSLTYVLLFLVLATVGFSFFRNREISSQYAASGQEPGAERFARAKSAFPTADFEESDTDNSVKGRALAEKRKRYDTARIVPSKPVPWVAERVITPEGQFNFPALPVQESDAILIATVLSSAAHTSSNKKNVFSEFTLNIESILKASSAELKENSSITVDRQGGVVKYPNGQTILFRLNGVNMPVVGSRYLFFLENKKRPDFTVLTAYELTPNGILALDLSSQFLDLEGITETEVRNRIQSLLKP